MVMFSHGFAVLLCSRVSSFNISPISHNVLEEQKIREIIRTGRQISQNGFDWNRIWSSSVQSNVQNSNAIVFRDGDGRIQNMITRGTTPKTVTSTFAIPGMETTRSPCENSCLITPQYSPICGTDTLTYTNPARLKCAQDCGKRKSLVFVLLLNGNEYIQCKRYTAQFIKQHRV